MDKLERFIRMAYNAGLHGGVAWYDSYFERMAEQAESDGKPDVAKAIIGLHEKITHDQNIVFPYTMQQGAGNGTCKDLRLLYDQQG